MTRAGDMRSLWIDRADTGVILIDAQVKLAGAMPQQPLERALKNWLVLVEAAGRLKLPLAVSEQYPQGLGHVLPVLKESVSRVMPPARWMEKVEFSLCESPMFEQFLSGGRRTWIVSGMETHICVYQTVRSLVERGFRVHVPADAVVSRQKHNHRIGLDLMRRAGAVISSTETLLFDLLKRASGEDFRALSKLIK
jgi:nicotinamidase-related amidase